MTAIRPENVAEWHDEGRGDDGNLYFCIMLKDGRTVDLKMPYREVRRHELEMALQYGEEDPPIELTPEDRAILEQLEKEEAGAA